MVIVKKKLKMKVGGVSRDGRGKGRDMQPEVCRSSSVTMPKPNCGRSDKQKSVRSFSSQQQAETEPAQTVNMLSLLLWRKRHSHSGVIDMQQRCTSLAQICFKINLLLVFVHPQMTLGLLCCTCKGIFNQLLSISQLL